MSRARNVAGAILGVALLVFVVVAVVTHGLGAKAPSSAATGPTFTNPIQAVGQDPYVVQWRHRYWLVEVRDDDQVWLERSPVDDLTGVAHRGMGVRIWTAPQHGDHCTDAWAPELHHVGRHWFVYYSATTCDGDDSHHKMFALESSGDDLLSRWHDAGKVAGMGGRWAIDGTRMTIDGSAYLVWSGWPAHSNTEQDIFIARMSNPTTLATPRHLLSRPSYAWETRGAPIEEGPEALQRQGRTFLVYSASGSWTDHYCYGMLTYCGGDPLARSSWAKSPRPVFASTGQVFGPGHGSFVRSPDSTQWWMIYHSAIAQHSGWWRQIDAQPFGWSATGAPLFGRPAAPDERIPLPSGQPPT